MASYFRVGILGSSQLGEVWSINPVFDPTGEFGSTVNQGQLDAAAQKIGDLVVPANILGLLSTSLSITGARVEVRDSTNDHLQGTSLYSRAAPQVGTGTAKQTAQTAVVFSLRTNTPGASGRGRLYWPAVGSNISSDLRISTLQTGLYAGEAKSYLQAMRDALSSSFPAGVFDLAIRSRATRSTPHVVRIQVGNVLDTQRRRRDTLPESYSTVNIP